MYGNLRHFNLTRYLTRVPHRFQLKNLQLLPQKISALVGTGLGAGTLADCIITGALVYFLRRHKSGFNQ